ncbi:MAG TPA: AAA family ATPase, partial [Firmicutes bacterium]|nr:AAA family ATPase [Bacillota bacterium]
EAGVNNGDDIRDDSDTDIEANSKKILNAISAEPKATQKRLAEATGLSTRTISREIKNLRDSGIICRIGSDRSGFWKINNCKG